MWKLLIILSILLYPIRTHKDGWAFVGNPLAFFHPCKGKDVVVGQFESGKPPGEENQYELSINEEFPKHSKIMMEFDSDVTVKVATKGVARILAIRPANTFIVNFYNASNGIGFHIKGPPYGVVPYLKKLNVNTADYCKEPNPGVLDGLIEGDKDEAELSTHPPDGSCGRRQIAHTELIVNGQPSSPGDWPWHTAIYRVDGSSINYICGGTLVSKLFVLTAAHCVISNGVPVSPDTRNVILGKHNLAGGDIAPQERAVNELIVHEELTYPRLDNDIALMKLKSEVIFSEYVQPACLWYADAVMKLPSKDLHGTVVGWGFDQTDKLSPILQQINIPKQSDSVCIKSNPVFFSKLLNSSKFCAGLRNGTSACNGDSGGGFTVFVPDEAHDSSPNATGAWFVRGIVSLSIKRPDASICDPNEYSIFTDVGYFKGWIEKHIK